MIDDEEDVLLAARLLLKRHFAAVETLRDVTQLPEHMRQNNFDVLLLDMNFSAGADTGAEGLEWLSQVLAIDPLAVVVLVTAHGEIDLAVQAMKQGAADFVVKPWENERLIATLTAAANLRRARLEAAELRNRHRALAHTTNAQTEMIGAAPSMQRVFDLIARAAPTDVNVLILGENGTGKELVAREIHRRSARADEPFVRVDLGSISSQLFEAELFGHRRGAYTDAKEDRIGRFRAATGGTLFLDEIGNVPLHLQTKLLTTLERREVAPIGSDRTEPIDVRLICATNLPAIQLADEEIFRQDLLYRINTVEITLSPLRERVDDIPLLLEHFVALYGPKYNMPRKRITAAALEMLTRHPWPGNVRALRHAVERAVILSQGAVLDVDDFPLARAHNDVEDRREKDETVLNLDTIERTTIARALAAHGGNVTQAAQALGLTRASLYRRMEKYGL